MITWVKVKKDNDKERKLGLYVPFKNKLETILSLQETVVFDKENNIILENKKIYSNITDGSYVKKLIADKKLSNSFLNNKNEKTILNFAMYYDDIEVVNAIGVSRKKHKLGK
jgi:hypothetical protein